MFVFIQLLLLSSKTENIFVNVKWQHCDTTRENRRFDSNYTLWASRRHTITLNKHMMMMMMRYATRRLSATSVSHHIILYLWHKVAHHHDHITRRPSSPRVSLARVRFGFRVFSQFNSDRQIEEKRRLTRFYWNIVNSARCSPKQTRVFAPRQFVRRRRSI